MCCALVSGQHGLSVPDTLGVFVDASIAAEETHACDRSDTLRNPLILITVCFVDQLVRLNVAVEVIRNKIEIPVLSHSSNQGAKVMRASERALLNFLEYLLKVRINCMRTVGVGVSQVIDIFGQITKEEDVAVSDFPSNLNLVKQCQLSSAVSVPDSNSRWLRRRFR